MATDGPDPTPCDPEVFKSGECIFVTHTIPSNAMEGWVAKVRELSGQKVDWHFAGGRALILFIGDEQKVMDAITQLLPEHDELYRKACTGFMSGEGNPPRPSWEVNQQADGVRSVVRATQN